MWSTWSESAKASLTQALEKTGDAISKAATQAGKSGRKDENESSDDHQDTEHNTAADKRHELLGNIQAGWSSVVETTRASIKSAQGVVEEQQSRLQERLNEARARAYKRDINLPLDVVALKDAQVVYITDRLITMSHPAMASSVNGEITGERKLAAVGHLLQRRHNGRFMVWNISEVEYETRILDEQVLTFSFPGSPSPPLGLLLKLLISMEAWLKADDRNVAVVHCLTGKGRTSTVLAAFLCWMGQAGFGDIYQALEYIAACKQLSPNELTIPSQRRYASYFKNMLDGVRPSQPPMLLKRIIMSEAPKYAKGPPRESSSDGKKTAADNDPSQLYGCAPYLQIFKAGVLVFTAPALLHYQQSQEELPFVQVADGSVSFNINQVVQGDILVRCRHLTSKKQRVSMFRAAFHTGYVPPKVMRLKKSELDGACNDDRFADDFFIDLIFEAVDAEEASKLLQQQEEALVMHATDGDHAAVPSTGNSTEAHALAGGATHVTASSYDTMLHRDSRFWDVIAARRQEQTQPTDENEQADPTWGPTIGRRRDFSNSLETETTSETPQQKSALETFSIGGELDFLPGEKEEEEKAASVVPPKKDSLMEALMGALNEDESHHESAGDLEVVVFQDTTSSTTTASETSEPAAAGAAEPTSEDAAVKKDVVQEAADEAAKVEAAAAVKESEVASQTTASDSNMDDMEALLADANLNLDGDMEALLANAGEGGAEDADLLDIDDAELEDLENFLSAPSK